MTDELKIWIAVRRDLKMPAGKMAAQVAHAVAALVFRDHDTPAMREYARSDQAKIVVRAADSKHIMHLKLRCTEKHIPFVTIIDAGRTFFAKPTWTCFAVGPCKQTDLPEEIAALKLY